VDLVHVGHPTVVITAPAVNVAVHFRFNDVDHAIQDRVHVVAAEVRVAQVGPTVDVRRPEFLVFHQGIENRNVPLATYVTERLGIARICVRRLRRDAGVIRPVTKRVVHVPQRVAPLLAAAIGMAAAPPRGVPVQPVGTYGERVEQVVINQAHHVVHARHVFVVVRIGHVLTGHEVHQRRPIGVVTVLYPRAAPGLDEVNKVTRLVVVLRGKVKVVHLLTVFIHAPIFPVEVDDAALVRALVDVQIRQVAQRLNIGIADVSAA